MARRCQITGVGPRSGNTVSHAHNKARRRFLPNLQKKRLWVQELNKFVTVKLSTRALRTISRNGTSQLAKLVRENKIKVN
ncbi:MAG: 50S ribosomal protein L28 [Ignavibacteria bacterium]|nr:50S ribosomal protein L28 [Ignavibacteria bacterium]